MDQAEEIKQKLMEMVIAAKDQRYRPFSLVKAVSDSSRIPLRSLREYLGNRSARGPRFFKRLMRDREVTKLLGRKDWFTNKSFECGYQAGDSCRRGAKGRRTIPG